MAVGPFGFRFGFPVARAARIALLSSLATNGWLANWASTPPPTFQPNSAPIILGATQQGFTATAGYPGSVTATTHGDFYIPTLRYREPAPNDATLKATEVVLDRPFFSTTTINGVSNPLAIASPKPVGQWTTAGRRLIDEANPIATGGVGNFSQEYDGRGTIKATTTTRIDPQFIAPACTTLSGSTYTSGAGGGNYRLQAGSPAKNAMIRQPWSPAFDLDGVPRGAVGTQTSMGAYA